MLLNNFVQVFLGYNNLIWLGYVGTCHLDLSKNDNSYNMTLGTRL